MTIRVRQNAPRTLQFTATAEGHALPLDMPQPQGGGPDPHDYFDTALGGCKAMTVMLYAQRKEIPLESVDVDVVRDAGEERKGIYRLTAKLTLHGALSDAQIDELHAIAEKCPVHKLMTAVDVQVSTLVVRPA
ncbi:OsmC family protein [Bordetella petrii]|uniref:OsmC family protein n=1 Tax=Bordetella petrii TaxID=94624 RepID=UPI00372EC6E4